MAKKWDIRIGDKFYKYKKKWIKPQTRKVKALKWSKKKKDWIPSFVKEHVKGHYREVRVRVK